MLCDKFMPTQAGECYTLHTHTNHIFIVVCKKKEEEENNEQINQMSAPDEDRFFTMQRSFCCRYFNI